MWVKLTSDATGWTQTPGNVTDTYFKLESIPYLEVRGPAPGTSLYYIGCELSGASVYLNPGYSTQALAESALDEFVKSEQAGGVATP